jgi:hypothetical protein
VLGGGIIRATISAADAPAEAGASRAPQAVA